jgi:hypothetical protein
MYATVAKRALNSAPIAGLRGFGHPLRQHLIVAYALVSEETTQ